MQWAQRRRVSIATGIVCLLAVLLVSVWYFFLYEPATCFDGVMNQDEQGIDCDGVCARMCIAPRVDALWTRPVQTAAGVYHGVSLVQNPEPRARGVGLTYRLSLFDSKNILVAERRGTFDLMPGESRVVFEPNVTTGERLPVRALMKIDGGVWERTDPVVQVVRVLPGVVNVEMRTLSATIENMSATPVTDVVANALLFDSVGVVITASETNVPFLQARERHEVVFTWSVPFARPVATSDIFIRHTPPQ